MLTGAFLRLCTYFGNRSLWVDEAMLAISVVNLSFRELTRPLPFYQAAPVGFLFLQHLLVKMLGSGEYVLRLVPLLSGLASIVLFYALVKRLLSPAGQLLAMALFVFSPELIYYSSEAKQYQVDVFASLGTCCLALLLPSRERAWPWLALALWGAVVVWFSHPSVFVLAALGICFAIQAYRQRNWRVLAAVCSAAAIWLASLASEYFISLREASSRPFLVQYWLGSFAPLPPRSFADLQWYFQKGLGLFHGIQGDWKLGQEFRSELAAALFVFGVLALRRRNLFYLAVLTLPGLFALAASAVYKYPFSGRLLLFLAPFCIALIGAGFDALGQLRGPYARTLTVVVVAFLLLEPVLSEANRLLRTCQVEEVRPILALIQSQRKPGDIVYLYRGAVPPFLYYSRRYGFQENQIVWCCDEKIEPGNAVLGRSRASWDEYEKELQHLPSGSRVWMVFSHHEHDVDERKVFHYLFSRRAKRLQTYEEVGAYADLYEVEI